MKRALLVLLTVLGLTALAQPALADPDGDWQHKGYPYGYGREHAYRHPYGYQPWYWHGHRHWYPYGHRYWHPYGHRYWHPYGPGYPYPYGR